MMIGGAVGFYLGIDTPALPFHPTNGQPSRHRRQDRFLGIMDAVGTFLTTLTAFASVGVIILRLDPHIAWTTAIMAGWVVGLAMQIIAGAIARTRR